MLKVIQKGFWIPRYIIHNEDEEELCTFEATVMPRKGTFIAADNKRLMQYGFQRARRFSGDYLLYRDGEVIGRARKPKLMKHHIEVTVGSMELSIAREKGISPEVTVRWDGEEIGSLIQPKKKVDGHMLIDLPDSVPLYLQCYLLWLAFIFWESRNVFF